MPPELLEIAKQIPALVVLVWLVIQQARHNEKRDENFISTMRSFQNDDRKVMEELRAALRENSQMLGRVLQHLEAQKGAKL